MSITNETRGGACRIALERFEAGNAIDEHLIADLTEALVTATGDPSVRVIVLTATGRNFSVGPDPDYVARMSEHSAMEAEADVRNAIRLLRVLDECPKPTVARIEGAAAGLAVGLVACVDVAIAAEDAEFAVGDVRLGAIPAAVAPFLVRAIGARHARRLILTGDRIRAADARTAGLVHEVAPRGQLDAAVDRTVISLSKGGPAALAAAKAAIAATVHPLDIEALDEIGLRGVEVQMGDEAVEGLAAQVAGRRPSWI